MAFCYVFIVRRDLLVPFFLSRFSYRTFNLVTIMNQLKLNFFYRLEVFRTERALGTACLRFSWMYELILELASLCLSIGCNAAREKKG